MRILAKFGQNIQLAEILSLYGEVRVSYTLQTIVHSKPNSPSSIKTNFSLNLKQINCAISCAGFIEKERGMVGTTNAVCYNKLAWIRLGIHYAQADKQRRPSSGEGT